MSDVKHSDEPEAAGLRRLALDRSDPTLLHEQVAAVIRRAIADGEAVPGQRIPFARDLAAVLEVNRNTVLRALRLLRDEGLVDMRRGRPITVTGNPEIGTLTTRTRELIDLARRQGYHRDELVALIYRLS